MNKVVLEGVVVDEPKIRYFGYGHVRADFKLYTEEDLTGDRDTEDKRITLYHNVQAWGSIAEDIERYLRLGQFIRVEGRITYDSQAKGDAMSTILSIECQSFTIKKESQRVITNHCISEEIEIDWSNFSPSLDEDPMA